MKKLSVLVLAIGVLLSLTFISMPSRAFYSKGAEVAQVEKLARARQVSYSAVQNSSYNVRSAQEEFNIREAFIDHLDMAHVRMDQTYNGLKVFTGELITHFNADGSLSTISGEYFKDINIPTTPKLNANEAINIATQDFGHILSAAPTVELMVLPKDEKYHLAYRVEVMDIESNDPAAHVYFVSAKSGKILFDYNNLETQRGGGTGGGNAHVPVPSVGTGNTIYSGVVSLNTAVLSGTYQMKDLIHYGSYTNDMKNGTAGSGSLLTNKTNVWGNSLTTNTVSAAADAHYGLQVTLDYYKQIHNRNGIKNTSAASYSRVHYGRNYNNAFWSDGCSCMTYGDGDGKNFNSFVALDVAGHEVSHGVTSNTAGLIYSGQSGGLNEATSDIFGTSVEFFANNTNDPGDYLIGEKITLFGPKYLRNMADPRADGASIDHFTQYNNGLDVHYSSGLANIFFYLLSEGGTNKTSGQSVTGITRTKAEQIWYRALTTYMTSGTTFAQARTATLNAARDLYGSGSTEMNTVAAAWTACGVN